MVTRQKQLFWVGMAALTIVCVFILPFAFPPRLPTWSSSYTVGFNNRVAALATVLISLLATLVLWQRGAGTVPREPVDDSAMPKRWLGYASLAAVLFTALLGWRVVRANVFYGDSGYFIEQLTHGLHYHATLYRDFEFAYGPLLYWWPASFIKALGMMGIGLKAAYMVSLAAMQVVGLAMVFYILGKLSLSRRTRGIALAILTFGTLEPMLAMNYTMFRFALGYAAVLWIADRRGLAQQATLFGLAQILMLTVSAELGMAFALGACALGVYRAFRGERRGLLLCGAPVIGALVFAGIEGRGYFRMLGQLAEGAFNSVVDTSPHIFIFLLLAVVLAPLAVAGHIQRHGPNAAGVVGMYGASLGMVPFSLGRCDALHTFFGGVGLALLALLAIDACSGLWLKLWLGLFALSAVFSTAEQSINYRGSIQSVLFHASPVLHGFDMDQLMAATHGQKIAAPVVLPQSVRFELMRDDKFETSYFCNMVTVWDEPTERLKVAEMRRAPYALLPLDNYKREDMFDNRRLFRLFRFGYSYREKHPAYLSGVLIEDEVQKHWVADSVIGHYMLYRQK